MTTHLRPPAPLKIHAPVSDTQRSVLTPEALRFVGTLADQFAPMIDALLKSRVDAPRGHGLNFLAETESVRGGDWRAAPIPADLLDRRVEITGPVDRKMIINALNSGAQVFMADFEDSTSPTWDNMVDGQIHLRDAVSGSIRHEDLERGKIYELGPEPATLMVRPRGLHLLEHHVRQGSRPIPACLFDFGLFFFHNAQTLLERGSAPYFYLPKLESYLEARLWNEVFVAAQELLSIPIGTIRATVLIETLPAAFQMDEILYELRDHSAGLNCGRWDYIFSYIKTMSADPGAVLPDRAQVTMEQPFMRAYCRLVVRTCHRRGVHAMGGMAAQIPIKDDAEANQAAMEKVRQDKLREVTDGHDGTWVAHPGLIPLAREVFDAHMPTPNQIDRPRDDEEIAARDLLEVPLGTRTEAGLRQNVSVGLQYVEAWLRGHGCVPLYHLMEDAATAEISRTQLWQWIRHGAPLHDGRLVTKDMFRAILREETQSIQDALSPAQRLASRLDDAASLFDRLVTQPELASFLTTLAYDQYLITETSTKE